MSYLLTLAEQLAEGLADGDPARWDRHAGFIRTHQTAEGGFRGREGEADLYYTSFALRGLTILGRIQPPDGEGAARFLGRFNPLRLNTVDLLSWLDSALVVQTVTAGDLAANLPRDWTETIWTRLEQLRRPDGGYAKSSPGALGSTYHSFLVTLIGEFLGRSPREPEGLLQFLYDQQRDDGGFVEIAPMKRSGTNPTAAAGALLERLDAVDAEIQEDLSAFFQTVASPEGGFAANTRIPFPDSLSTFTALLTCRNLGLPLFERAARAARFVEQDLEFPTGGIRAAGWDDQADVEYTFYGLGVLALARGES